MELLANETSLTMKKSNFTRCARQKQQRPGEADSDVAKFMKARQFATFKGFCRGNPARLVLRRG